MIARNFFPPLLKYSAMPLLDKILSVLCTHSLWADALAAGPTALARSHIERSKLHQSLPPFCLSAPSFTTQSTECPMSANRPRYHYLPPPPSPLRVVAPQKRHFGQMSRPSLLVAAADRHTPPYAHYTNRLVSLPCVGGI